MMEEPIRLAVGPLGANCYILPCGENACAAIDPGDEEEKILSLLARQGFELKMILLTHGHFDHTGAAAALREHTGAPITIGARDRELLEDPQKSLAGAPQGGRFLFAPDRTVAEGDTILCGGRTLSVLETPGHTQGGVCYLSGDMLFSGDTLFAGGYGRTDFYGGDFPALHRSLGRLAQLPRETRVYPGHGEATSIGAEQAVNPMMGMADYDDIY